MRKYWPRYAGVYCNIQGHARLMFRPPLECATSHRQHTFLYIVFVFKWMHYNTISNIKEIINSKRQVSYVIAAHLGHTIINYVPGRTQMGAETAYNQFGSVSKLYTSSVTCVIHKEEENGWFSIPNRAFWWVLGLAVCSVKTVLHNIFKWDPKRWKVTEPTWRGDSSSLPIKQNGPLSHCRSADQNSKISAQGLVSVTLRLALW